MAFKFAVGGGIFYALRATKKRDIEMRFIQTMSKLISGLLPRLLIINGRLSV